MSRRHPEDLPGFNRRWPADRPQRRCAVDGCDRPHYGHGYCSMHWQRLRKTGSLGPAATLRQNRRVRHDGYIDVWEPTHPLANSTGYVAEHRKVAHDAGLLTDPSMHVHHRNHNKQDNRLANLEVLTGEEHARRHAVEDGHIVNQFGMWPLRPPQPPRPGPRPCLQCGTEIPDTARTDKVHCSPACRVRYCKQRKKAAA